MIFVQIKRNSDNFSYIIADEDSKEAAIVDPSFNADVIRQLLEDKGLKAKYIINTHGHRDHTAGNQDLKSAFGVKIVAHKLSPVKKDLPVSDGEMLTLGKTSIKIIHTPGHSPDSICLLADGKVLTGDTLFVGECGRTDMGGGSAEAMYHSLFGKLMKLDYRIEMYPGHDYGPKPSSTIGEERRTNYTLKKRSLEDFIEFMSEP